MFRPKLDKDPFNKFKQLSWSQHGKNCAWNATQKFIQEKHCKRENDIIFNLRSVLFLIFCRWFFSFFLLWFWSLFMFKVEKWRHRQQSALFPHLPGSKKCKKKIKHEKWSSVKDAKFSQFSKFASRISKISKISKENSVSVGEKNLRAKTHDNQQWTKICRKLKSLFLNPRLTNLFLRTQIEFFVF